MSDVTTPAAPTDARTIATPIPVPTAAPPRTPGWRDPRMGTPKWPGPAEWKRADRKLFVLFPLAVVLAVWYFNWLLRPERVGDPVLYGLLVLAELFNLVQAAGFWWTCRRGRDRPAAPTLDVVAEVDVFIPVYDEPIEIVAPTIASAVAMRGAAVTVYLLDDAGRPELRALAERHRARYVHRGANVGAKAGNLNHGLGVSAAPIIAVFDCDHVPSPHFLEQTIGWLEDDDVAFVQTPQYYANARHRRLTAAAASQQALFFGGIARGKDGHDAMICCGTNFVARRRAIEEVGGFPTDSLTEDFALSIRLREQGWRSVYVNRVLAQGLGPEDMASYVSQQQRWTRGCLAAIPEAITAELPWRARCQYLLSSMFFLSGWMVALYMSLPVIRIWTGLQPLAGATASQFLLHFAPYFCVSLAAVAVAGAGAYTFDAFALMMANFWVQVVSTVFVVLRRTGRFVVTAKQGDDRAQPLTVLPALVVMAVLSSAIGYALEGNFTGGTLNNVAFAGFHLTVLLAGVWPAIAGRLAQVKPTATSLEASFDDRELDGRELMEVSP